MRINVTSNAQTVKLKYRKLGNDFSPTKGNMNKLFRQIGIKARNRVKRNITEQLGFAKVSKWTEAKTGRRKALLPVRSMITYKMGRNKVEVGMPEQNGWNGTKHHKGFYNPPEGRVTLALKNPRKLKISGSWFSFNDTKGSYVPARPLWGTSVTPYLRIAGNESTRWVRGILAKRT